MEEREEVTFDIEGPIGPIPQSVSNLTSFVGTIDRNKKFVTLLYTSWHAVPQHKKRFMWRYINFREVGDPDIRDAWKRFKAKIKQKHFIPYDNIEDLVKNRPLQEVSQRNKKNKEQQKFPHRMGPVNFARVRAALRESKGTNEEPKRFEVFIATRTSRKRKELDERTQSAIQASGATEEEAFQSLFGKEQPGRLRCYGRSVTQTDLQKHHEISAIKQQHQEEVTTLRSELGDTKTQ
ncbi:hypothetical protein PIB30_046195 [Stylosanthes scabra]|uniref:Uncharacterized protein n=1 Tax=Stylosanthes scabra TaxID=79078 RepID=A0ABU6YGX5_9FABA|nr:hypothetical protein [Stylosanthes scabra]